MERGEIVATPLRAALILPPTARSPTPALDGSTISQIDRGSGPRQAARYRRSGWESHPIIAETSSGPNRSSRGSRTMIARTLVRPSGSDRPLGSATAKTDARRRPAAR